MMLHLLSANNRYLSTLPNSLPPCLSYTLATIDVKWATFLCDCCAIAVLCCYNILPLYGMT